MPYLIIDKFRKGYKVVYFSKGVTIGRDDRNDIILNAQDDNLVSRQHANIKKRFGIYTLHDTSANGTFINNKMIKTHHLAYGDQFQIMDYYFTFVEDSKFTLENAQNQKGKIFSDDDLDDHTIGFQTVYLGDRPSQHSEKSKLQDRLKPFNIVAESERMITLFTDIDEVARINVPILILGEHGTGKEKVANTLHHFSKAQGEFVALNCSAIPEGIFESELFGSTKGAFNGATDRPGKLEQADKGTIFLDEIADMSLEIQPKLLRFLEDKIVTRLGSIKSRKIDIRVICATNQDLEEMVRAGKFRADLYQRIACIKFQTPPLRERVDDILPLANFFLAQFAKEYGVSKKKISAAVLQKLTSYSWPGNIRELHNVLINAAIRCKTGEITPDHLEVFSCSNEDENSFHTLQEVEKRHIQKALQVSTGNRSKAAILLGISRDTLYNKMQKYSIEG